jgi:TonB family protein
MALTEIPPAPSSEVQPGLHDAPVLLIQLQDDLARSRLREAFWISVVFHLVLVIGVVAGPKYLPVHRQVALRSAEDLLRDRELTFVDLPKDNQKVTIKPNTNKMSDKDRIATSRAPRIDRKALDELRDARPPGPPGAGGPPMQTPPATAQNTPPAAGAHGTPPPAGENTTARLESPPAVSARQAFGGGAMSPGSAIEQAARAAALSRGGGYGGAGGDYGLGSGSGASVRGNLDVLSDTMGVDFGPYLSRVLHDVRFNWYQLIPEVARAPLMKRGKVSIEFAIMKDGSVAGLRVVGPSGDVSLDRAAYGGINLSNPFPPLPGEFRGQYLALRFHFFYNPDKHDLE